METERIKEARSCHDCINWHKHCNAECCKSVLIGVNLKRLYEAKEYLLIKVGTISPSDQYYYKLRGVRYTRGTLRFRKDKIKIIDGKVYYKETCSMLDGNMCKIHFTGKPKLCQELTIKTCHQTDRFVLTPNCLFKYKLQGGNDDGKN